ncbi:hypothetical protein DH2020_011285 [Rehmannia glutinosa]|uniref:Pentatricopeptide repeat-containing protein n=1 Tax=Rehmannia glutinosa TaxID=99300 RepID=A0ABR0XCX0_REHGL
MEALSSCNLTPKPQPEAPLHLLHTFHQSPLKTLLTSTADNKDPFIVKASAAPLFPLAPPKQKPKRVKSIVAAKQVHAHIRINGLMENEFLQTKLVQMYAACGSIDDAKRVFESMSVTSVYPWNALLRGNVVLGGRNHREVLGSFLEMRASGVELNVYSFSCLIKSLAGNRALRQGLKTHGILIKNGLLGSCIVRTSLIDMYFKCGKIKLACSLFEEVEERDVVVWGAMIAVIGEVFARKIGQEVHAYVIKTKDYSKQLFIQSALVDMYCKCGDMVSGRKVFYGSMERSIVSWTALLSGYVANERLDQALRSIIWMQQEGFKPDVVTIASSSSLRKTEGTEAREGNSRLCIKKWNSAKRICFYFPDDDVLEVRSKTWEGNTWTIFEERFEIYPFCFAEIVKMYGNWGAIDKAKLAFDAIPVKGSMTWTAIIEAYGCNGQYKEAIHLFKQMISDGFSPNQFTFKVVLHICEQGGFADDALSFFTLMTRKYKIKASEEHYTSIIDLLTHLGRIEEADKFIQLRSSLAH